MLPILQICLRAGSNPGGGGFLWPHRVYVALVFC